MVKYINEQIKSKCYKYNWLPEIIEQELQKIFPDDKVLVINVDNDNLHIKVNFKYYKVSPDGQYTEDSVETYTLEEFVEMFNAVEDTGTYGDFDDNILWSNYYLLDYDESDEGYTKLIHRPIVVIK